MVLGGRLMLWRVFLRWFWGAVMGVGGLEGLGGF